MEGKTLHPDINEDIMGKTKQKPVTPRKGARTVNVDGVDYFYFRGSTVTEIVNSEDGSKSYVKNEQMEIRNGVDERGNAKYSMTPGTVSQYIRHKIRV